MRHLAIVVVLLIGILPVAAQEAAPAASNAPAASVAFEGKTQLYINWVRPLTVVERTFLASVPEGCDADGQEYRELVEACFRAGIAHANSAPRYGWIDGNGVVYNYAYYCRLLQPADASHTWRLRLPVTRLPELGQPAAVVPAAGIAFQPATLGMFALDFLPVEGKNVEVPTAATPTAPCRPTGGAIERGGPAREVREPIAAITITPDVRDGVDGEDGEPGPEGPEGPPGPDGPPGPPGDGTCGPGAPTTPEPSPGDTTPPDTAPPIGDGGGWGGPNQPPDAPVAPGVDGQPQEPAPQPAE